MKRFGILLIVAMAGLVLAGCNEDEKMIGYAGPIEKTTLNNNNFRQVLYTGKHSQLVVMSLQPGEEIGRELHQDVDQFFRIEQGNAKFIIDDKREYLATDGDAVLIPAGTYHNVINISAAQPLKLYSVYSPPIHPERTLHKTKAEAESAEHH
jgi:mannose-6-phosphate isomerase-like protein (cupin superfamily)